MGTAERDHPHPGDRLWPVGDPWLRGDLDHQTPAQSGLEAPERGACGMASDQYGTSNYPTCGTSKRMAERSTPFTLAPDM